MAKDYNVWPGRAASKPATAICHEVGGSKLSKFGRGFNREIVGAVNRGELREPLTTATVLEFALRRGWAVRETHLRVTLANAASSSHSPTYRKYFEAVGRGRYRVRQEFRGAEWR